MSLSVLHKLSCTQPKTLINLLVQSDNTRIDWFRALLTEKAHTFQIVVFTCRPSDYLAANAIVSKGKAVNKNTDDGFVRAIDLTRALRRIGHDIAELLAFCIAETSDALERQYRHIPPERSPVTYPLTSAGLAKTAIPLHSAAARYYASKGYIDKA